MEKAMKNGQNASNTFNFNSYFPNINRKKYCEFDLHHQNEINLNILQSSDGFFMENEDEMEMLNKKSKRTNGKEKMSNAKTKGGPNGMKNEGLKNSDEFNFNMLKYNLSSQTINNTYDFNMNVNLSKTLNANNRNNIQIMQQNPKNDFSSQFFQNNLNLFSSNNPAFNNMNNISNLNNLNVKKNSEGNSNCSFESTFIKEFLLKKINQILSSDNTQEKLMLYFIITNSDNFFKKCESGVNNINQSSTMANTNNNCVNSSDSMDSSMQKEVSRKILYNFCKHLEQVGYSIVPCAQASNNNIQLNNNEKLQDSMQNTVVKDDAESLNDGGDSKPKKNKSNTKKNKDLSQLKKAWLCPHIYRVHYARGKCQNCYLNFYHKEQANKRKASKGKEVSSNVGQDEDEILNL